jgi:hypothetical protein
MVNGEFDNAVVSVKMLTVHLVVMAWIMIQNG